ncbi:MAG: class I SAM-dependent methyltransferase [Deltaproteobacteria bacterium]|nr:class I SAM-dependent methyltransferase [Deltaproteobacteria bacterium]
MAFWLHAALVGAGLLFLLKAAYVLSTGVVLPATGGALFVSTSRTRVDAFLDAVPMGEDDLLVDLGCGDGRVLARANQRFGVAAVGFEVNPAAVLLAKARCLLLPGVRVRWKNFFSADLSQATVVFCYLFPDVAKRVAEKLAAECAPGTWVASANFPLPGFLPERVLRPKGPRQGDPIYLYRMNPPGDDFPPEPPLL